MLTTDVPQCARCGHTHTALSFTTLADPITPGGYTHFAECPTNKQPVLVRLGLEPVPAKPAVRPLTPMKPVS